VMAKTSLVFRLKAGISHFLKRELAMFHLPSSAIVTANAKGLSTGAFTGHG
jgi:hypothetical protein